MKTNHIIAGLAGLLINSAVFSQVSLEEAKKYLDVPGGVQNVDKKVLKEPSPQAIPYIAIKFRTGSVETLGAGKGKDQVTAKAYAVLDGIDSTTFQEITNEFAKIFEEKLKSAGLTLVDLNKIKESKSYKKFTEEVSERNFNHKDYGTATVYTQDHTPFFYYPTGAMKIVKYMNDNEAGAAFLRLTIDFTEFDNQVSKSFGWYSSSVHFSSKAFPVIKLTSDPYPEGTWDLATGANKGGGFSMSDHKKFFTAVFGQTQPIYENYEAASVESYDNKVPKFATRKFGFFGGAMQLGTFVIEAKKESYKAAALKALTRYADCVVEIIKSYNQK